MEASDSPGHDVRSTPEGGRCNVDDPSGMTLDVEEMAAQRVWHGGVVQSYTSIRALMNGGAGAQG